MRRAPWCTCLFLVTALGTVFGISACNRSEQWQSTAVVEARQQPTTDEHDPSDTIATAESTQESDRSVELPVEKAGAQPVFRPDDRRPKHDDSALNAAGIRIFESKRLKLYTDLDAEIAQTLPPLVDQAYEAWEQSLGPLPPDRAGTDFQITGYLIRDLASFREFKLVPDGLVFEHGRHLRNEFWMHDQVTDYYRQHLLLHEATHCFMTYLPDVNAPVWYLEGMAEYFGTHRQELPEQTKFCVMPTGPREFSGFGRIDLIRDAMKVKKPVSIGSIFAWQPIEFTTTEHYAWSWALCAFLDGTPRYRERFRSLSEFSHGNQFHRHLTEIFTADDRDLVTAWTVFTGNLQYGYDLVRAAIDFRAGTPLETDKLSRTVQVEADRGWQSTGISATAGQRYEIVATGRCTLAEEPKPWISEPQGISIRYFRGHPIGMLIGCLRTDEGPAGGPEESMLRIIPLGARQTFVPDVTGTLYLRINDAWNSLHDNRGQFEATLRCVVTPE